MVYHHRGAYTNAISNVLEWDMPKHAVYLWTLPMFHCNGWCFPWAMAANAGTHVCLRRVDAKLIFEAIRDHGVTHMCGAGIVYAMLINAPGAPRDGLALVVLSRAEERLGHIDSARQHRDEAKKAWLGDIDKIDLATI